MVFALAFLWQYIISITFLFYTFLCFCQPEYKRLLMAENMHTLRSAVFLFQEKKYFDSLRNREEYSPPISLSKTATLCSTTFLFLATYLLKKTSKIVCIFVPNVNRHVSVMQTNTFVSVSNVVIYYT